jgi:ketosteroid isomerase-like protein
MVELGEMVEAAELNPRPKVSLRETTYDGLRRMVELGEMRGSLRRGKRRTTMKRSLAIVLLSLLLPCLVMVQAKEKKEKAKAGGGDAARQAVEKVDDQVYDAAKRGDTEAFGNFLADDYTRIDANGQMRNKAETIELYKSGQRKIDTLDLKNRKVRVYGNTAIVTRENEVKGHVGANDISGTYRDTVVYVKGKNGQWQDVNFQSTKVQR